MGPTAVHAGQDNKTNWLEDALHQATGGLADKAEAALKATGLISGGVQAPSFSDRYHSTLTNVRNDFDDYETANPGWAGAKSAHAAGVIAPMLVGAPEANAAKTMGQAALRSGATGAGLGAAYGFGGTNDESVGQDVKATGIGALAGGATGSLPAGGMGISKVPFRMARQGAQLFGKPGLDQVAGRVLNDAATTGGAVFEKPPLPDMKLTTGQASNDPGLLWLERSVRDGLGAARRGTLGCKHVGEHRRNYIGDRPAGRPRHRCVECNVERAGRSLQGTQGGKRRSVD